MLGAAILDTLLRICPKGNSLRPREYVVIQWNIKEQVGISLTDSRIGVITKIVYDVQMVQLLSAQDHHYFMRKIPGVALVNLIRCFSLPSIVDNTMVL